MNIEELMDLQNRINSKGHTMATPETVDVVLDDALQEHNVLQWIRRNCSDHGLPAIEVSAQQGRMLETLVRSSDASSILEVGTLGGYSTTCMALGAGARGNIDTIEFDPHHAEIAAENFRHAGVNVFQCIGDAHEVMLQMIKSNNDYDFVFIDADKESNADYLKLALQLTHRGSTIVVDNVIRDGRVIDPSRRDKYEFIRTAGFLDRVGEITASVVQTVGAKGWDGFVIAVKN